MTPGLVIKKVVESGSLVSSLRYRLDSVVLPVVSPEDSYHVHSRSRLHPSSPTYEGPLFSKLNVEFWVFLLHNNSVPSIFIRFTFRLLNLNLSRPKCKVEVEFDTLESVEDLRNQRRRCEVLPLIRYYNNVVSYFITCIL